MNHLWIARLTALADDELILAHRDAEWKGHAPILEEDIALANIAQDELGHATLYYGLLSELTGRTADQMAFFRDPADFRNAQLLELPKGDWAFTMVRQYLYDAYEYLLISRLRGSSSRPVAEVAAKIYLEEIYHLRHSHNWVERLGLGTDESNRRMQTALNEIWPYAAQLFVPVMGDEELVMAGRLPNLAEVQGEWQEFVTSHLNHSELVVPAGDPAPPPRHQHTPHLSQLLADIQLVTSQHPEAKW